MHRTNQWIQRCIKRTTRLLTFLPQIQLVLHSAQVQCYRCGDSIIISHYHAWDTLCLAKAGGCKTLHIFVADFLPQVVFFLKDFVFIVETDTWSEQLLWRLSRYGILDFYNMCKSSHKLFNDSYILIVFVILYRIFYTCSRREK